MHSESTRPTSESSDGVRGAATSAHAETLKDVARAMESVGAAHAQPLRARGFDDLAEQIEDLALMLVRSAQELEAATELLPPAP